MDHKGVALTSFLSISFFLYDVGSDIALAIAYYNDDAHEMEFAFTTAFIIGPLSLCGVICAYFICQEYDVDPSCCSTKIHTEEQKDVKHSNLSKTKSNKRIFFIGQLLLTFPIIIGPLVRHIRIFIRSCRRKNTSTNKLQTRTAVVILIEAYYKSATQLMLQLYLITKKDEDENDLTRAFRYLSMIGSAMGLAWALVSVRRTNREADDDDENDETIQGSFVFFLARLFEIGPRILLMTLFIIEYQERAFIFGAIHCSMCSFWTFAIDRTSFRCKPINIFLKILLCYPMLFCFVDLDYVYTETSREHIPTRYKMTVYYTVYYVENVILLGLWLSESSNGDMWYYLCIVMMTLSVFLHFFFQVLYYKVFHPSSNTITWCVKLNQSLCFYTDPNNFENVESEMIEKDNGPKAILKSQTFTIMSL